MRVVRRVGEAPRNAGVDALTEDLMETVIASPPALVAAGPRTQIWTGRVLTGLIAAFLLLDAGVKLVPLEVAIEGTQKVGYAVEVVRPLGVVLAASTLLHLFPRTQLVGAALLTAYLGGAVATHVRL